MGILVMTSGNISEEPICYDDEEALHRLSSVADYFLSNNRPIHTRCDDSVVRVFDNREYPLRRSRGYAPFPIILNTKADVPILATGAEQKNTFCLLRENQAFVSHHIGDLENEETYRSFTEGINHYQRLFGIEPEIVAHDMHPRYFSTDFALNSSIKKKIAVQHHHAHIVSCMADNNINGNVIGIALDGVGYGDDGTLWGCEFLAADETSFRRRIHLEYVKLPGGEKAVREPWRTAAAYLFDYAGEGSADLIPGLRETICPEKIDLVVQMIGKNINCPKISSAGRLFDAASALMGIRLECNFEGQAAISMEMMADSGENGVYPFQINESAGAYIINPTELLLSIANDMKSGVLVSTAAGKFHNTMAEIIASGAQILREETGENRVVLSGGVFQNLLLMKKTVPLLEKKRFAVFYHRRVPANDGGISLGQAVIGSSLHLR
jgi:hydrogenase maturation protein HypF